MTLEGEGGRKGRQQRGIKIGYVNGRQERGRKNYKKKREKESRKYLTQIWENQKKKKKKKKKKVDMSIQEKIDQELRRGRKVKGKLRKRTTKSAFWENKEEVRIRKKGKERKGKERKGKERKGKERKGKERKGKERKRKKKKGGKYLISKIQERKSTTHWMRNNLLTNGCNLTELQPMFD